MTIDKKILTFLSLVYLYLPVFVFLLAWVRILVALTAVAVCLFCFCRFFQKGKEKSALQGDITVDRIAFIFALCFFIWIGYYAGYGRFVNQVGDWEKHNAVLKDLVGREWPVLYYNNGEKSMLTYYLGQYIIPAAIGKVVHSVRIAELALYAWNTVGLVLVFMEVCVVVQASSFLKQFILALSIPFFSIPLWISELLLKRISGINSIGSGQWFYRDDTILIQYSSNFTLLRWVFPQTIPIWLAIAVFLLNKDKIQNYVFLLLPALFFGTLAFIGILPLAAGAAIEKLVKNKKVKEWFRQVFNVENILMSMTVGAVFAFYFWGNVTGEKPDAIGFHVMPYTRETIDIYICFVAVNVLPYALILFRHHKSDAIYFVSIGSLIILPLFKMGQWNDLTMRASIPALFILMIYILQYLFELLEHYSGSIACRLSLLVIIIFLISGMYYPFAELSESVQNEDYTTLGTGNEWDSLESFANRSLEDVGDDVKYNYYSYDIQSNFFCEHIMRR